MQDKAQDKVDEKLSEAVAEAVSEQISQQISVQVPGQPFADGVDAVASHFEHTMPRAAVPLIRCKTCGLELDTGVPVCPNDGTAVFVPPTLGLISKTSISLSSAWQPAAWAASSKPSSMD